MKIVFAKKSKKIIPILIAALVFGFGTKNLAAQTAGTSSYVPLIGITSVPEPLALPKGAGIVTYLYSVKNFLPELPLADIKVVDDKCSPVTFTGGDDNGDGKLDYSETWRYSCSTKISTTTVSIATAAGMANNLTATHQAYAMVVVGSKNPPPLVSIVNITKVAYPLSLPVEGGVITYTYKVNNPGVVPLSDVAVTDDKCGPMSGKLGDINGNNLLDVNEVWIYTCAATLRQTTANTATVTAYANSLKASDSVTITVKVLTPAFPEFGTNPNFPDVGANPNPQPDFKITVWEILFGILAALVIVFVITRKRKAKK